MGAGTAFQTRMRRFVLDRVDRPMTISLSLKHCLKPCAKCPFVRDSPLKLTRWRIAELIGQMLSPDATEFPCHETAARDDDGDFLPSTSSLHCAGALIFAEKNGNATQWMRWMERIGAYDRTKLEGQERVFDSLREAYKYALRRR